MAHDKQLNLDFQQYIDQFDNDDASYIHKVLNPRFEIGIPSSAFGLVRYQIRNALIFQIHEAAITLTNNYLERFLKIALVESQCSVMMTDYDAYEAERIPLINKYGSKDLQFTLSVAKRLGIITKPEWKVLDKFREHFRNPYSHYDNEPLIPDESIELTAFNIDNPETPSSSGAISLKALSFGMGHYTFELAKEHSLSYFIAVDDVAMRFEMSRSIKVVEILKSQGKDPEKIFNQAKFGE